MTRPLFPVFAVPHCVPLPEAARLRSTYAARRFRLSALPRQKWVTDSKGARVLAWVSMTPAAEALAEARAVVAAGGYEFGPRFAAGFGSNREAEGGGLYVENPEAAGLRYVGTAEELSGPYSRTPRGYYLDSEGSGETVSGVVYQMAGRDGRARFVAGYADPYNGTPGNGPACLWFGQIYESEPRAGADLGRGEGAKAEAARAADSHAERMAEAEREYQEAFRAGQEAREKAAEARAEGVAWVAAVRGLRGLFKARRGLGTVGIDPDSARALIRAEVAKARALCESYHEARADSRDMRAATRPGRYGMGGRRFPPGLSACQMAWAEGYSSGAY